MKLLCNLLYKNFGLLYNKEKQNNGEKDGN